LFGKLTQGGRVLVTLDSSTKKLKLDFLGLNNTTSGFNVLQDTLLDVEMGS